MEAASGFEPLNKGFADLSLSHLGTPPCAPKSLRLFGDLNFKLFYPSKNRRFLLVLGAGGGIRTPDPNLGKVVLYQLSYTRTQKVKVIIDS